MAKVIYLIRETVPGLGLELNICNTEIFFLHAMVVNIIRIFSIRHRETDVGYVFA